MSIAQSFPRTIESAGGESVRLKAYVRKRDGTDVPKQFSASSGSAPPPTRRRIFLAEA
jgi:hypothetical protein